MLNYISAELYKVLHRKYPYITLAVFLLLESLMVAANVFHNAHSSPSFFGENIVFITTLGSIGFCVCMLTGDMVFAGQYKNSTLKNEVSFGLSRERVYLGKLIAQTLMSVIFLVVMMGFFIGMSAIFLPHSMDVYYNDGFALIIVGYYLAVGFPLWVGTQAVCCMCLFLINSDMVATIVYMSIVFALDTIVQLTGIFISGPVGRALLNAYEYFPNPMLGAANGLVGDWTFLGKAWIVGLFWVAVSTAVGIWGFKRKEIK